MTKLPTSKSIKDLAEILNDSDLSEIEVEADDIRIRVAREITTVAVQTAPAPAPTVPAPTQDAPPAPQQDSQDNPNAVKAPMVGTVYLAPEPGSAPFIKVGDTVTAGQTLFIVEAMKTMNPITAPKAGKVTEICVTNEQPIEFDEVLVIIE